MSDELDLMAFTDPRSKAEFDDWPSGRHRVKCRFYTEHILKRGFRVYRQTTDKNGKWCTPKCTTFGGQLVIVTGSDGRTYILQMTMYSFVSITRWDFMSASPSSVFPDHPAYQTLVDLIVKNQDPVTFAYEKVGAP
jgi:hypothetical protein